MSLVRKKNCKKRLDKHFHQSILSHRPEEYKIADAVPEVEDNKENIEMKQDEAMHHPEIASDIPTKCVQLTRTIAVNASITYIDFEGRSDGESLQKILAQLRPRRVVFVRGSTKDTEVLAQQAQAAGARVFIPARGETLDATTETHIYQVCMTAEKLKQLGVVDENKKNFLYKKHRNYYFLGHSTNKIFRRFFSN